MKILLTGCAGFIGFHIAKALSQRGDTVIGIDSLNKYYDVQLKYGRLEQLGFENNFKEKDNKTLTSTKYNNLSFKKIDISNKSDLKKIFEEHEFDSVCNLAAQAGVRYSLEAPEAYVKSNISGFLNILENCRDFSIKKLIYASSSSVYGLNSKIPFSSSQNTDHPISLYAATKKSNELMAHTYSHLFGIKTTGLRFFTVYGPWGRPDMALFKFVKAALRNEEIEVYNNGKMLRDFTYIDDIKDGVLAVIDNPAAANRKWEENNEVQSSSAPYKIYNIGNNKPVKLMDFIEHIEEYLNLDIKKKFMEIQPGDVEKTYADIEEISNNFNFLPKTDVKTGVKNFIDWYKDFYQIK